MVQETLPDEAAAFLTKIEEGVNSLKATPAGRAHLALFQFSPEEMAWREKALCAGMGETIFFPDRGFSMLPAYVLCHSCPVRIECLQSALDYGDDHGVRGGFTPYERNQIKDDMNAGMTLAQAIVPRVESREGKLRKARTRQNLAKIQALQERENDR